ncbi:MAG: cyclic nucleotide-binding domain-containing protein [Proteobacteria bacterium]|nr:cyclic nucleotide-binding domain-containing protein [Pseudomonadota bacterium]
MIPTRVIAGKSLTNQVTEFFMSVPFFERINSEEIKVIAKHIAFMEVKKGDVLFNEADKGNYICFIVSGILEVVVTKETTGQEVVLATLSRGQSTGEMAIIEDMPRFATIRAINDSTMYVLSKSAFELILSKHPHIGIKLLKGVAYVLSHNLRQTSMKLANYM